MPAYQEHDRVKLAFPAGGMPAGTPGFVIYADPAGYLFEASPHPDDPEIDPIVQVYGDAALEPRD